MDAYGRSLKSDSDSSLPGPLPFLRHRELCTAPLPPGFRTGGGLLCAPPGPFRCAMRPLRMSPHRSFPSPGAGAALSVPLEAS